MRCLILMFALVVFFMEVRPASAQLPIASGIDTLGVGSEIQPLGGMPFYVSQGTPHVWLSAIITSGTDSVVVYLQRHDLRSGQPLEDMTLWTDGVIVADGKLCLYKLPIDPAQMFKVWFDSIIKERDDATIITWNIYK